MLNERKIQSQVGAVTRCTVHVLREVAVHHAPADRVLGAYLRNHHELGGRDRRVISETLYALFRWWGWVFRFAPLPQPAADADTAFRSLAALGDPEWSMLGERDWSDVLLAGRVLEGLPREPADEFWAGRHGRSYADLVDIIVTADPETRAAKLMRALGQEGVVCRLEDLVPAWVQKEIGSTMPLRDLVVALQKRPPLWLRIQAGEPASILRTLRDENLTPQVHERLTQAIRLASARVNLNKLSIYNRGHVEVQDLASQAVGIICGPISGERWWDACAGGGGKSLHLAQLMAGKGTVVASDVSDDRLHDLRRRAARGGFSNIVIRDWDGSAPRARQATYDGVLVDAPCSGSGTWRRNPSARWSRQREDLAEMTTLQSRLLRNAARGVRPGGRLVYATCSMFTRENEGIVHSFLAEHAAFHLEPFDHPITGKSAAGMLQIWPADGDCDAMFVARMRRTDTPPSDG